MCPQKYSNFSRVTKVITKVIRVRGNLEKQVTPSSQPLLPVLIQKLPAEVAGFNPVHSSPSHRRGQVAAAWRGKGALGSHSGIRLDCALCSQGKHLQSNRCLLSWITVLWGYLDCDHSSQEGTPGRCTWSCAGPEGAPTSLWEPRSGLDGSSGGACSVSNGPSHEQRL